MMWSMEQLVKAAELMQSTCNNGCHYRLKAALIAASSNINGDGELAGVSLDDFQESCGLAMAGLGIGEAELQILSEVLRLTRGPDGDRVPCHVMALRMGDRIVHPESILDG